MKTLYFYNKYHLGDCIFFLDFARKLVNIEKSIRIILFCNPIYIAELKEHVVERIEVRSILDMNVQAIDCWINSDNKWNIRRMNGLEQNKMLFSFWKDFCQLYSLTNPFNDEFDMLFEHERLYENRKFDCYDYLIINSVPLSGQFMYNDNDFEMLFQYLNESGKTFILTKPDVSKKYPCTRDFNFSVLDIGCQSMFVKKIIAVNTSPIITCLNRKTLSVVEDWYILSNLEYWTYKKNMYKYESVSSLIDDLK